MVDFLFNKIVTTPQHPIFFYVSHLTSADRKCQKDNEDINVAISEGLTFDTSDVTAAPEYATNGPHLPTLRPWNIKNKD